MIGPAILLCGPDDLVGRLVDACTGWRGWSHVAWATGREGRDGFEVAIDVHQTRGVEWSTTRAVLRSRAWAALKLDRTDAEVVEARLRRRVGEPYSIAAMLVQPTGVRTRGAYCSRVLAEALPARLQRRLPSQPSPADFEALRC